MAVGRCVGVIGVAGLFWVAQGAAGAASAAQQPSPAGVPAGPDARAVLNQYCVPCHNERLRTAGLVLDSLDVAQVSGAPDAWEKVVHKLRSRSMPPPGRPRPDDGTYDALASWLETSLDDLAAAHPRPGRVSLHRLNRAEYRNAIRDLLALDVDVSELLPTDNATYGFDNIADALGVSPLLLESYVTAARKVSRLALGNPLIPPIRITHKVREDLTQNYHLDGLPLGSRGGLLVREYFPVDAEYEFRLRLRRSAVASVRGIDEEHRVELTLDGARLGLFAFGGPDVSGPRGRPAQVDDHMWVRVPVPAGDHAVVATFVGKPSAYLEQKKSLVSVNVGDRVGLPYLDRMVITGPYGATGAPVGATNTPSRQRIFVCQPTDPSERSEARGVSGSPDDERCAHTILSRLARQAYRRPLTATDIEELLGFYRAGRGQGGFEAGIELALRFLLASPQFVFRFESDPEQLPPDTVYRVTDVELASRLSFFLWSSLPDDELLAVAERGRLSDPIVFERQVQRMLADPRSEALVSNFAGQWLHLRNLPSTSPDPNEFPDFDENLRRGFQRETELFFESVMREDRSILDLLTADYTFVNARLARHYGIPGVYGDRFRRVGITDDHRRGLLGQGSILTVTSYATRTTPVLRGKWVLENLLGAPPPPPPSDVPELEDSSDEKVLSMRERLAQHRQNSACAACHAKMDPIGFGLSNFDAVGRWRTIAEDGNVIDASGRLADGTQFDGPVGLREALLSRPEVFVTTFTNKMLTYALGRGLTYHDAPGVRAIVRKAADQQYRFSSIIRGIVNSEAFRMRTSSATEVTKIVE